MKNVLVKFKTYANLGAFNHIYFVNGDYDFNDVSLEEIVEEVEKEPFFAVMVHAKKVTPDVMMVIEELSKIREIWYENLDISFQDFLKMMKNEEKWCCIDKISIMIDTYGNIVDIERSLAENHLVKFNYMVLPF